MTDPGRLKKIPVILTVCLFLVLAGCKSAPAGEPDKQSNSQNLYERVENRYAKLFTVDRYEGELLLVSTEDGRRILCVPEGCEIPKDIDEDVIVLKQPVSHVYLAASAAADMVASIGALGSVDFCATEKDSWHIEAMRRAMEDGSIRYAGKYGTPDYEMLTAGGCCLAVENMMISHAPEVIDKLEEVGIPVIIDHASYETDPLGRMEWVKFYGALFGCFEEAEKVFEEQRAKTLDLPDTGKMVAFFYLKNDGSVGVRRADDYVPAMIKIAGGRYVFDDVSGSSHLSTTSMQMEEFYARAKDADYIVYNGTTAEDVHSIAELLEKSSLLEDFKAVKEGHAYAVSNDMYQNTMSLGTVISDFHLMMTDAPDEELIYLEHLY